MVGKPTPSCSKVKRHVPLEKVRQRRAEASAASPRGRFPRRPRVLYVGQGYGTPTARGAPHLWEPAPAGAPSAWGVCRRAGSVTRVFLSAEFEVNVVVLLHADHLITENFPLKLCRV